MNMLFDFKAKTHLLIYPLYDDYYHITTMHDKSQTRLQELIGL